MVIRTQVMTWIRRLGCCVLLVLSTPMMELLVQDAAPLALPHSYRVDAASQVDRPPSTPSESKPDSIETPSAQEPNQPRPIPLPEVASRLEQLNRRLTTIALKLTADQTSQAVEERSQETKEQLETQLGQLSVQVADQLTLEELLHQEEWWVGWRKQLSRWRQDLSQRITALEADRNFLRSEAEEWGATLRQIESENIMPPAGESETPPMEESEDLPAKINQAISRIEALRPQVREQVGRVLTLENTVTELDGLVSTALDTINARKKKAQEQLLERDSPPIWRVFSNQDIHQAIGAKIRWSGIRVRTTFPVLIQSRKSRLSVVLAIFFIVLMLAKALKRRVAARLTEDHELGTSIVILKRPFSIALLLSMLVNMLWVASITPPVVHSLMGLLLLVPILRLFPPLMSYPTLQPLLYLLAIAYLVNWLILVLFGGSVWEQLLGAATTATVIAVSFWLARRAQIAQGASPPRRFHVVMVVVAVILALLGASLLADIFGYMSLSRLISDGTLHGAYLAVILYCSVRVLTLVISLALRTSRPSVFVSLNPHREVFYRWVARSCWLLAFITWFIGTLEFLRLWSEFSGTLSSILRKSFPIGSLQISLGNIVAFIVTVMVAFVISRLVRFILREEILSKLPLARGLPNTISTLVYYAILLFGFTIAVLAAGLDLASFTLLTGALGVGIGFGLQNIVNNFVSGIILLFERPINIGDIVEVGELIGEVRRIGMRASVIGTFQGAEVIVPNSKLVSDDVVNWTLTDQKRRLEIRVGVAYGTDPERVIHLLESAAAAHPEVLPQPPPFVFFQGFGESSLNFELRCWVAFREFPRLTNEITVAITKTLGGAGIEIPFPQRDLHVRSIPTSRKDQPSDDDTDAVSRTVGCEEG